MNAQPLPALFVLLSSWSALCMAANKDVRVESITWLTSAPEAPASGANRASADALVDRIQPFVAASWPQVRHQVIRANPRRIWQMISSGEKVCQSTSIRTAEREKLAYFADAFLGPPMQLIVNRKLLDRLPRNAAGEVDLVRLIGDGRLHGGLVAGRSYGSFIDGVLARRPESKTAITRYANADYGSKLLPMLGKGRVDYTIDYEVGIAQWRTIDPDLGDLVSQPIAGASMPLLAGVVCPRTPWGLAAIRGIDKALGTPAGAAMLRESAEAWLTPETQKIYGPRMDAFFKQRAKPSVIR